MQNEYIWTFLSIIFLPGLMHGWQGAEEARGGGGTAIKRGGYGYQKGRVRVAASKGNMGHSIAREISISW